MSATATLPLPLELTQPRELACNPQTELEKLLAVANTRYNPETQVRDTLEGCPQILDDITISVVISTIVGVEQKDTDNANDD